MKRVEAKRTPISCRKLWSHKGSSISSTPLPKESVNRLSLFAIKREKIDNGKGQLRSRFGFGERKKYEKESALHVISGKKRLNGHRYKELLRLKARRDNAPGPTLERKDKPPRGDCSDTEACVKTSLKEGDTGTSHKLEALDGQAHHYASRFLEYWVPVQLSDVQREQYCASLLSNSMSLCSYSKNDSAESLHDILISSRKCCDHPYLVDRSIRTSVIQGVSVADQFDAEIEISGKLKLLDKILLEIKKRGLRVLIVFQKLEGSGLVSVGDILDDFIHEKYGEDSYARIDDDISRLQKRAAANMFNNKDEGKFVCLIETRACFCSIKLLSIDAIILFDSDWDPLNDIRAVQKITIDSQFEKLKIFRLYSCCTVEEKMLILAKQGMAVDSNSRCIKQMTYQKLLSWGACHQFSKLNYYDNCCIEPASHSNVSSEQTLFQDVLRELFALLPNNSENIDFTNCSAISEVQRSGRTYSCNISLLGELKTDLIDNFSGICQLIENEPPHIFWRNLLQGRRPRYKYLPNQRRKIKKKLQLLIDSSEESELDTQKRKKVRKEMTDIANHTFPKSKLRFKQKLHAQSKKSKFAGASRLSDRHKVKRISIGCHQRKVATSGEHDTDVSEHSKATTSGGEMPTQADSPIAVFLSTTSQDNPLSLHQEHDLAHSLDSSIQPRASSSALQPPTSIPVDGSNRASADLGCTSTSLDRGNNHHVDSSIMASELPQPACSEPLQMEMDKIQRDKEQAIKLHEEMKLQLQSECEKEIQEIRKKYDLLLQNAEMEFLQKMQDIETSYNKVYVNRLLAGAMIEKHNTAYPAASEGTQKVTESAFLKEMYELYLRPAGVMTSPRPEQLAEGGRRPSPPGEQFMHAESHPSPVDQATARSTPVTEQSLTRSTMTILPPATSVLAVNNPSGVQHTSDMTPLARQRAELQVETQSSGVEQTDSAMTLVRVQSSAMNPALASYVPVLSSGRKGQLSIPTIHYSGNNQVSYRVRAPAPHLRNTRCPLGVLKSRPQSLPIAMTTQHSPSNIAVISYVPPRSLQDC